MRELATREDLLKALNTKKSKEDAEVNEMVNRTVDRVTEAIKSGKLYLLRGPINERVMKEVSRVFAAQGIKVESTPASKTKKGGGSHNSATLRFSLLKNNGR